MYNLQENLDEFLEKRRYMYKLEGRLETTCTHVKGIFWSKTCINSKKSLETTRTHVKGNVETQCTNQRKFGNTMDKFRKKSRKNNVQLEGKFRNKMYRLEGTCANTRYKFQMQFGSIAKKGKGKFGETNVQCTTHNSQESLETQCIH